MRLGLLGQLETGTGGSKVTAPKPRALLAYLAVHRDAPVSTDRIAEALWGNDLPKDPAGAVAFHVSRIRALVGEHIIETTPLGYRLGASVETDIEEFTALVGEGRDVAAGDPERGIELLDRALALWRGPPLADVADADFAQTEIRRLDELRLQAEEGRAEASLQLGEAEGLVARLEGLVAAHPLRERSVGLLMDALLACGRPAEALAAHESCRARLVSELGVAPGAALQARYDRILGAPEPGRGEVRNPYKGLRPFLERDAGDFFGREDLVADILERIAGGERFVALVGPSGSGKSSVLRAGVVPALRQGGIPGSATWPVAVLHPGGHPLEALEAAFLRTTSDATSGLLEVLAADRRGLARAVKRLAPDEGRVVVIIDQFEELYRLPPPEERDHVEALLAEAIEDVDIPLVVLVGLRADYYDRPLGDPRLAVLFGAATVALPPLRSGDLERAIAGPAQRVGVTVASELEAQIMTDVLDRPGELPLLQYALTEVFDRRRDHQVGVAEYEEVGGVVGALAATAERLHAGLSAEGRDVLRRVLLDLVAVDAEGESSRPVRCSDLDADGTAAVLRALDEHRLITLDRDVSGAPIVEVAHEALFWAWARLAGWIEERRDDLRMRQRLAAATRDWEDAGEDAGYLLTGTRLQQLAAWAAGTDVAIPPSSRRYLEASVVATRAAETAEAERAARERATAQRAARRTRLAAGLVVVALLVGGLAAYAWDQRNQANDLAAEVERVKLANELTVASIGNLSIDPELSILLAYEAMATTATVDGTVLPEAVDAMHWALQEHRVTYPLVDGPTDVRASPFGFRGVFELPPPALAELAAASVTRGLTQEECLRYVGAGGCSRPNGHIAEGDVVEAGVRPAAAQSLAGTSVTVVDPAGNRREIMNHFTELTGIQVVYIPEWASAHLPELLAVGETPDAFLLPQPGALADHTASAGFVDLSRYLGRQELERRFGRYLTSLGTIGADGAWPAASGAVAAFPIKLDHKSLIWYSQATFAEAGYAIPETWSELEHLVAEMKADGHTPWCLGLRGDLGEVHGWPATDWVEDVLLHTAGPDVYDDWTFHRIPFNDPKAVPAFERYGTVVHDHGVGPRDGEWTIENVPGFWIGILVSEPEVCRMMRGANYSLGSWLPEGVDTDAFGVFRFPTDDPSLAAATVVGAQYMEVFTDRPEVRALVHFVLSDEWGDYWANDLNWLSADADFDESRYSTEQQRQIATWLQEAKDADLIRFDASDLMPASIGTFDWDPVKQVAVTPAFWDRMVEYTRDRSVLDEVLAGIEQEWQEIEAGAVAP